MIEEIRAILPDELEQALLDMGEKKFRAEQILQWIYQRNVESYDEMTNLSLKLRQKLDVEFPLSAFPKLKEEHAEDGSIKIAYPLKCGGIVESVLIPTPKRLSLCVSSELGCSFNCAFCRTGHLGFGRRLSASEILTQVHCAQRLARERLDREITNIIYMGMGEPFHNLEALFRSLEILLDRRCFDISKRKITVSSVGHVPGIRALGQSKFGVNLAISLHAPNDELRSKIMPVNRQWGLDALFKALHEYPLANRQRITFEYILIKNLNMSARDAAQLVKRLHALPSKVNLIPFNPFDGCDFERPSDEEVDGFRDILLSKGVACSVRRSRGSDTLAACGQLGQIV
ncbi:MAG: 23S rRNA (adenine(2503)-C(2))-methyltransferase RlmN [Bradymonadales bacterium]|jgi:23S rRNA (adenine2503-C2)-methyltransferase